MNKQTCLAGLEPGTAAYVIAHARWQRSRGRGPSMKFLAQRNPRKALAAAVLLAGEVGHKQRLTAMLPRMPKTTPDQAMTMDIETLQIHVRRIVAGAKTKDEISSGFERELGIYGAAIAWHEPTDQTGREARELVTALGGLVSGSGAMVMLMFYPPMGGDVINM